MYRRSSPTKSRSPYSYYLKTLVQPQGTPEWSSPYTDINGYTTTVTFRGYFGQYTGQTQLINGNESCRVSTGGPGAPFYEVSFVAGSSACYFNPGQGFTLSNVGAAGVSLLWGIANNGIVASNPDGTGRVDPAPTPEQAKQWAQAQMNNGHWNDGTADALRPMVDAVIRGSRSPTNLERFGITGNPGNSFDGRRW